MLLYHFTSVNFLDAIRKEGLTRGEVPLSQRQVINGVWLTTDPNHEGHGLSDGGAIPVDTLRAWKAHGLVHQTTPEDGSIKYADKRSARITVKIPSRDSDLKRWISWGRKRLAPEWFDTLSEAGGGHKKARSWYVCFRTILPSEFHSIEVLRQPR